MLVTVTDTVTVPRARSACRSTVRSAYSNAAVAQAVPEREQRGARLVPVPPALVLRLVRAGVGVDHRHLPDGARPGERQLAAGRDVAEQQIGDRRAALGAGIPDVEDRRHVARRPSAGRAAARSSPAARPACRSRRPPAAVPAAGPGSSSDDRDAASPIMFCHSPTTTTATSAAAASSTAVPNSASSSKPSGSAGGFPPNMSNIDGNIRCTDANAGGVVDPDLSPTLRADAVEHGHGLVQVEVEDPRPEGVAPGVGQRPDHRDRARARRRRAAAGRPRCAAAPPTAPRRPGPPRGGPDRRAPPGRDPRRRTGRRTDPAGASPRAPAARARRSTSSLDRTGLQRLGQVRVGRVGDRHLHVDARR